MAALARALDRGEIDIRVHSAETYRSRKIGAGDRVSGTRRSSRRSSSRAVEVNRCCAFATASLSAGRAKGFSWLPVPICVVPLHGNVDSRLQRLDREARSMQWCWQRQASIVSEAAIGSTSVLDPGVPAPAPARGALAVPVVRRTDCELLSAFGSTDLPSLRLAVDTEREVLKATGGYLPRAGRRPGCRRRGLLHFACGWRQQRRGGKRVEHVEGAREDALELAAAAGRRLVAEVALR